MNFCFTMSFQSIPKVESPDFYLDIAFRRAKEKTEQFRGKVKITKERIDKSKTIELRRIDLVKSRLNESMNSILKSFPSFSSLDPFYRELVNVTLDYYQLKKSLAAVKWFRDKVTVFFRIYNKKIKYTKEIEKVNFYRREFYGRISSLIKRIKKNLEYLEFTRKTLREFPVVKTSVRTIVIVGFPNVGKTTLLYKLTGSKPEINTYAFTTKGINIGYIGKKEVQILDTPGTLNRFEKMNDIEKQAHLALKYLAKEIIYVFDLTELYPIEKQIKLYEKIKEEHKDVLIYLSKQDILKKEQKTEFKKKFKFLSFKELKELISPKPSS